MEAYHKEIEKFYPEILSSRYNLENLDDFEEAYNVIARKIGALNKGGEADYRRVSTYIINEIKYITYVKISIFKPKILKFSNRNHHHHPNHSSKIRKDQKNLNYRVFRKLLQDQ